MLELLVFRRSNVCLSFMHTRSRCSREMDYLSRYLFENEGEQCSTQLSFAVTWLRNCQYPQSIPGRCGFDEFLQIQEKQELSMFTKEASKGSGRGSSNENITVQQGSFIKLKLKQQQQQQQQQQQHNTIFTDATRS